MKTSKSEEADEVKGANRFLRYFKLIFRFRKFIDFSPASRFRVSRRDRKAVLFNQFLLRATFIGEFDARVTV